MKKAIFTIGLFSLMMVLTSFTSVEIGGQNVPKTDSAQPIGGQNIPRTFSNEIGGQNIPRT